MNRPFDLDDQAIDLVSGSGSNIVNIYFDSIAAIYDYRLTLTGGLTGNDSVINTGGQIITSGHTANVVAGSGNVRRPLTTPGNYEDHIVTFYSSGLGNGEFFYNYYIFQKSVAILKLNGTLAQNGYATTAAINDILTIDPTVSRGADVASTLLVQYKDGTGNWVNAVLNVDYQVISLVSGVYQIKILQSYNYRFVLNVSGYTTNNNPYIPIGIMDATRQLVLTNADNTNFTVDASEVVHVETITLPTISATASVNNPISSSPLTCYVNASIQVQGVVNYSTGVWLVDGVAKVTSNADWDVEMNSVAKIIMNVYDSNGAIVAGPFAGLGPHNVLLANSGNFNFKFVTST